MLESPVRDKTYGTPELWDYMEMYLCGKHNFQACVHYLKGEAQALEKLGLQLISVGPLGSKELLTLITTLLQLPFLFWLISIILTFHQSIQSLLFVQRFVKLSSFFKTTILIVKIYFFSIFSIYCNCQVLIAQFMFALLSQFMSFPLNKITL